MTEFVGRTGSHRVYSYPETPRRGGVDAYARNHATGVDTATDIAVGMPGTQVPWGFIDSNGLAGVNVPITPRVTGIVLITGVITVKSTSEGEATIQLFVLVNGVALPIPLWEVNTVAVGLGWEAIPFSAQTGALPINATANIQIVLVASDTGMQMVLDSSTIEIREVPAATG